MKARVLALVLWAGLVAHCGAATVPMDDAGAGCGVAGERCCADAHACREGLACVAGVCELPARACTVSGIADGALLAADFEFYPTIACSDVPPELLDPRTPGTYEAGSRGVGRIDCVGLAPGPATVLFGARVRLLEPARHSSDDCWCGTPWNVGIDVVVDGGATQSVQGVGGRQGDHSCRAGPDFGVIVPAEVGADGTLSVRVDLRECERAGATTNCLFLRGASLRVEQ